MSCESEQPGAARLEVSIERDVCTVCGGLASFLDSNKTSIRENYACSRCKASLRYRHQAKTIVHYYSRSGSSSFAELAREKEFSLLRIYEPGLIGPFREFLAPLPGYQQSYYWEGVDSGDRHEGVRCENLEDLTFEDETFDLVISSDIFEHVRRPSSAFQELWRVLAPGGMHIFTVPFSWPVRARTRARVDTSGAKDRHLVEPRYHGSPVDPDGSLVYTDFGQDLVSALEDMGFNVAFHQGLDYNITVAARRRR